MIAFESDAEYYATNLKCAGVETEKLVANGEDHSYLWYKLEVIEKKLSDLTVAIQPETHPQKSIFSTYFILII